MLSRVPLRVSPRDGYGTQAPGVFAGVLWLCAMRLTPQFDAGFTLAALVLFAVLTSHSLRGAKFKAAEPAAAPPTAVQPTTVHALSAGLAAGLISLANPATVLILAPWILFLLLDLRCRWRLVVRYLAAFTFALALCNFPWMLRNYQIWHAFALRTNFGMTLYSSNNDCAQSSLLQDTRSGCYQQTHPVASQSEVALLKRLGEVEFDRRADGRSHRLDPFAPGPIPAVNARPDCRILVSGTPAAGLHRLCRLDHYGVIHSWIISDGLATPAGHLVRDCPMADLPADVLHRGV